MISQILTSRSSALTATVLASLVVAGPVSAQTSYPSALTGYVNSQEESAMEGVLVSAKRAGSTMTITVASNAQGQYSFPRDRLEAGTYFLSIRAIGYELPTRGPVEVGGQQTATLDLNLVKTKNLAHQLSNGEWLQSFPGTEARKEALYRCVSCHTLERVANSLHDAAVEVPI
jgi:virginiamycin B lyase